MQYDVPASGRRGPVPKKWVALPIGKAALRRSGSDLSIVSLGVGVHRALEAAEKLEKEGISASCAGPQDGFTARPDRCCARLASQTGRLLVVDEDYQAFGLSGEVAALVLEAGISVRYARVCTQTTIPYARHLEDQTLPNVERICASARELVRAARPE